MSGVLETVAVTAGLASLAIQIVENIRRIRELYSAVKNAREDVQFLLLELELLGCVLAECSSRNAVEMSPSSQNQAVVHCRTAVSSLNSIISELNIGCGVQRYSWASVKVGLQRKKLDGFLTKIERLKTTLILAQLQCIQSSQMQRHTLTKPGNSLPAKPPACILSRNTELTSRMKQIWKRDLVIGVLAAFEICTHDKNVSYYTLEKRFSFASWISNLAFAISTYSTGAQIHRTLTTYIFVDPEAAIFKACAVGDDVLVQQLIDTGVASPFDVTNNGITPLHVAAAFQHATVCKRLLSMGADACASTWGFTRRETPLRLASDMSGLYLFDHLGAALPEYYSDRRLRQLARRIPVHDTLRALVEQGNAEIGMFWDPDMCWGTSDSLLHFWQGSSEEFLWAVSDEKLQFLGDELQEFYVSLALHCAYHDIEVINLAIDKVTDLPSLAQARVPRSDCTILHLYLSHNWVLDHRRPPKIPIKAVKKIVDAGADIHALDSLRRTPLMAMALQGLRCIFDIQSCESEGCSMQRSEEPVDGKTCHAQLLVQWISFLEREGLDTNQYFQKEKELGAERWLEMCEDEWAGHDAMHAKGEWFVRLIFEEHQPTREIKARFAYRIIEKRKLIPGAWVEDVSEP